MSRSAIYAVNSGTQTVADGGVVSLGSVIRRYGCDCQLSGDAILLEGAGYYDITVNLVASPTAPGDITATLYKDGVAIPGATSTGTTTAAGDFVTLSIGPMVRQMCCGSSGTMTCVLSGGEATVSNIAVKVVKE